MLGSYPEVSLKVARERKTEARRLLVEGKDPALEAKKAAIERKLATSNTFEVVARNWFELQKDRWTPVHANDVITSLENDVFPTVGALPVTEIDEPMVLLVLRKIEKRGAIETAHRTRQRMSAVFVHGIAEGVAARDPAAVVGKALKPVPRSRKRPAILSIEGLQDLFRRTEVCIDANRLLPCCAPRFRRSYLRLQCLALRWRSGRGRTVFVARKFGEDRGINSGSGGYFGG